MFCFVVRNWIQDFVDGSASAIVRRGVESHVAGCPGCSRVLRESRRLADLLSDQPDRHVSPGFEERLSHAIRAVDRHAPPVAAWERIRLSMEWRLPAPGVVAAAGIAAALIAVVLPPPTPRLSTEQRAFLTAAVDRHRQMAANPIDVEWDALDQSLRLGTGDLSIE